MPGTGTDFADIQELYVFGSEIVDYFEERDQIGNSNTPSCYSLLNDALADVGGRLAPGALGPIREDFRDAGRVVSPAPLSRSFDSIHAEGLLLYGLPRNGSPEDRLFRLITKLISEGELFESRNMTFGSPSGVSNKGALHRCTVDRNGYDLECTGAEDKIARCDADQNIGVRGLGPAVRHREVWTFEGEAPAPDFLKWQGSGQMGRATTVDCLSGGTPLLNPSFENGAGTTNGATPTSTTQFSGWVLSSTAAFEIRVETEETSPHAIVYKGYQGGPTGTQYLAALRFVADGSIEQIINRNSRRSFDSDRPYYGHIAVCRRASATGTLTFEIGSRSVQLDVSTLTNDEWTLLLWPDTTNGPNAQNAWPSNFIEDLANVKVTMASLATGTVDIDDCVIQPLENIDGTYAIPVSAPTPFAVGDQWSWTDSEGTRALFSYWLWRSYLRQSKATDGERLQRLGGIWIPTTTTASSVTIPDTP